MNRGKLTTIILIISMVGIGYLSGIASKSTLFAGRQTQYKVVPRLEYESVERVEAIFNQMGAEGWELIQVYNGMGIFRR